MTPRRVQVDRHANPFAGEHARAGSTALSPERAGSARRASRRPRVRLAEPPPRSHGTAVFPARSYARNPPEIRRSSRAGGIRAGRSGLCSHRRAACAGPTPTVLVRPGHAQTSHSHAMNVSQPHHRSGGATHQLWRRPRTVLSHLSYARVPLQCDRTERSLLFGQPHLSISPDAPASTAASWRPNVKDAIAHANRASRHEPVDEGTRI
jgi:hypothetical protein